MDVIRYLPAKELVQRNLPYCRFNQISPTHYFCNALEMIINHNSQVVGEQPITAMNYKIFPGQFFVSVNNTTQAIGKLCHWVRLFYSHSCMFRSMMQLTTMPVVNSADALHPCT